MHIFQIILMIFIVLNKCCGQQLENKGANAKTKEILEFIAGLYKQGLVPILD